MYLFFRKNKDEKNVMPKKGETYQLLFMCRTIIGYHCKFRYSYFIGGKEIATFKMNSV